MNKVLSGAAALVLASTGLLNATAAQAVGATATLTRDQWLATQEYADFAQRSTADGIALSNLAGVHEDLVLTSSITGLGAASVHVQIDASHTAATATMTTDMTGFDPTEANYYFSNGKYIVDTGSFVDGGVAVPSLQASLARLGKPTAAFVSTTQTAAPDGLIEINPAELFNVSGQNPLSNLGVDQTTMLYSPVICNTALTPPLNTTCTFSASLDGGSGYTIYLDASLTFDASGLMTNATITETSSPAAINVTLTMNQTPNEAWQQVLPSAGRTVTAAQLVSTSHKIQAELAVAPNANKILAKAKTAAKKAKKTLSATHLSNAAMSLKIRVTKIKNGVKLSKVVAGDKGSMCLTVSKGKSSLKHC
jgi:hypothetical protein